MFNTIYMSYIYVQYNLHVSYICSIQFTFVNIYTKYILQTAFVSVKRYCTVITLTILSYFSRKEIEICYKNYWNFYHWETDTNNVCKLYAVIPIKRNKQYLPLKFFIPERIYINGWPFFLITSTKLYCDIY